MKGARLTFAKMSKKGWKKKKLIKNLHRAKTAR